MADEKFRIVTGPIRHGSIPIHIYNDGLTVFLFDESNLERIREENPEILWGVGSDTLDDDVTASLLAGGHLLVYGLHGDGGVDLEVLVGAPLSDEELSTGRWYPPQRGLLKLPSGRLCVHSYNTLPMGDNGSDPEDEGAVVDVPPGEYIVALYRKDWDSMQDEGIADLDEAQEAGIDVYEGGRVDEVLVLTTTAEAAPLGGPSTILFKECVGC